MRKVLGNKGFTLVELVVVVGIIGIMSAIALPDFLRMFPHYNLKNAASEVASELQKARMQAVLKCTKHTVTFNYSNHTVTVSPDTGAAWHTLGTDWNGVELYSDTNDPSVPPFPGSSVPTVIFRTDGTAGHAGGTLSHEAIYLRNKPYNKERYRVSVLGYTGKVSMDHWTGGQWISGY